MSSSRNPFPRPLVRVMRRPTSIGLLLLAVTIAVVFALFGQWQLGRAVQNGDVVPRPTETARPITEVAQPRSPTSNDAVGQMVSVAGSWVAGDFDALRDRLDNGREGYWTVGHLRTDDGASLAVALGWSPDRDVATGAADSWNADPGELPTELTGRFQHSEAPTPGEDDDPLSAEMSPAAFVNLWQDPGPAYPGYITLRDAPDPLESIWSPAPEVQVTLNFLNVFYALEWVLFSGAALYIWYRLMRDIYERERDAAQDAVAEGETAAPGGSDAAGGGDEPDRRATAADARAEGAQRATVD